MAFNNICKKDVGELCKNLPRTPNDVKLIRIIKKFRLEDNSIGTKAFSVRRIVVLNALRWLKKYNVLYNDITIIEENLDWIENEDEQDLPCMEVEDNTQDTHISQKDLGPSTDQIADVIEGEEYYEETSGVITLDPSGDCSKESNSVCKAIEHSVKVSGKSSTMAWPYVAKEAVTEYDSESNLFPKAFPWLFPGGYGDYKAYKEEKMTVSDWARRMVLYQDGRFAKDKLWGFFALNYATRHKNQSSGGYFVDSFFKKKRHP